MPRPSPRMIRRRRFVTLVALGGAALVTSPLSRAAAAVSRSTAGAAARKRAPSAAIRREIAIQEKALAEQLETIRRFELPPGSPMAFVFRPLRARRRR